MIVVLMIGIGGKARTVVRLWIGTAGIQVSVMRFGMMVQTGETC